MDPSSPSGQPSQRWLDLASRWPVRMAFVLVLAAFLFGTRLGERAFWSEEVRWAEIPREMLLNANYWQPTINGKSYYDKPLGSYWLVLLTSWLIGALDETSVRLPSALSGILGVALTMLIARRLFDDDTALLAGIILATSDSYVFWSRHASADAETVAGVLAALWIFLRHEARPAGWGTLWLWLVMALTSLTKGLLGFALPLLILSVYASLTPATEEPVGRLRKLWARNRWLCNAWSLLAIPLGILVYLSPFLLSVLATGSTEGLEMVYRENLRRFYDPVNHRGPVYLYLYQIFLLLAPWSLLLPAALVQAHTQGRQRFILAYFWAVLLFFTLAASRRSYYLLPILPAGAILIAHLLTCRREALQRVAYRLLQVGSGLFALLVVSSIALLVPPSNVLPVPWNALPHLPHPWIFALAWAGSVAAFGFALRSAQPARLVAAMTVSACALMMYVYLLLLPAVDVYRTQKPFAQAVTEKLGPHTQQIVLYHNREIVFYLGQDRPLAEYFSTEELTQGIHEGKVRWLIVRRRDQEALGLQAQVLCHETIFPWEGREQTEGKLLLLEVGR